MNNQSTTNSIITPCNTIKEQRDLLVQELCKDTHKAALWWYLRLYTFQYLCKGYTRYLIQNSFPATFYMNLLLFMCFYCTKSIS